MNPVRWRIYLPFLLVFSTLFVQDVHAISATLLPRGTVIDPNINAIADVLQEVVIKPGETWSFNETIGDPNKYQLVTAFGVYGGGWCDLASRYAELARKLNLPHVFKLHSTPLNGVERQDNVSIWNDNGSKDQIQDLKITNNSSNDLYFTLKITEQAYIVTASYSSPLFLRGSLFATP
jgi:hypothetical protein